MNKINKYKVIFGIIYITVFIVLIISLYFKQNFTEYSSVRINYSQFQFEAHSNVKKLFRDQQFYKVWKNENERKADISDFIKVGEFDLQNGFVRNSQVNFERLRETSNTFIVTIKKTDLNKFKNIIDYLTYCTSYVEKTYKPKYPRINFQVSFPTPYFKKRFREFNFFVLVAILGSLFSLSVIFFAYEEFKSLKLLK